MIKVINTSLAYKEARAELREDSDCVVCSLASAFNISYYAAHEFSRVHLKRDNNSGTKFIDNFSKTNSMKRYDVKYFYGRQAVGLMLNNVKYKNDSKLRSASRLGISTKEFIKHNPKGTFLLHNNNHMWCVIDSVVHGDLTDLDLHVNISFKVNPSTFTGD